MSNSSLRQLFHEVYQNIDRSFEFLDRNEFTLGVGVRYGSWPEEETSFETVSGVEVRDICVEGHWMTFVRRRRSWKWKGSICFSSRLKELTCQDNWFIVSMNIYFNPVISYFLDGFVSFFRRMSNPDENVCCGLLS